MRKAGLRMADPVGLLRQEFRLLEAALASGGDAQSQVLRLLALARLVDEASWTELAAELAAKFAAERSLSKLAPHADIVQQLINRRLAAEIDRAKHCNTPLTLAVIQMDVVVQMDSVVQMDTVVQAPPSAAEPAQRLCAIAGELLRSFDLAVPLEAGRVLVVLSGTGLGAAERLIGGILRRVRQPQDAGQVAEEALCLCSAGLIGYGGCVEITPDELVARAEAALQQARDRGGNRLEVGAPVDVLAAPRETLVHANEKHFLFTGKRMPEK